jgi:hypothetical protein
MAVEEMELLEVFSLISSRVREQPVCCSLATHRHELWEYDDLSARLVLLHNPMRLDDFVQMKNPSHVDG